MATGRGGAPRLRALSSNAFVAITKFVFKPVLGYFIRNLYGVIPAEAALAEAAARSLRDFFQVVYL
jgi:hypothetical protein